MPEKLIPRIDLKNRTKLETVIPLKVPFIINVDPADACNFECTFCPTGDRELMKKVGRPLRMMDFNVFKKIVDDLSEFEKPIKVLRLYKDGEPLLNPKFADMVRYAKNSGGCERVDTTSNASLLNPKKNREIVDAGLDRINISVEGVSPEQYKSISNYKINMEKFVGNIADLYANKGNLEIVVKINGDHLSSDDKKLFYDTYREISDGMYIEHVMGCWPEFELNGQSVINNEFGIYGQEIKEVMVCPYVFYSFSFNSDGLASLCFLDWSRKLVIGDVRKESVKDIWLGKKMRGYQKMFLEKKRKNHPVCGDCGQMTHGMPDNIDDFAEDLLKHF